MGASMTGCCNSDNANGDDQFRVNHVPKTMHPLEANKSEVDFHAKSGQTKLQSSVELKNLGEHS